MVVKVGYIFVCLLQFISLHSCEKDFSACGLQPAKDSTLIIGPAHDPEKNPVGEWPWMASLGYYEEENWIHNCGATLISDKHLLTAAHCFQEAENCGETLFEDIQNLTSANCFKESINKLKIRLGVLSLNVVRPKTAPMPLDILDVSLHPKYDRTAYFDVAIIITDKITFTKKVRPICLPSESSDNQDQYQQYHMTVTGWGSSFLTGVASDTLKRAEVIGYSQASCNRTHQSSHIEFQTRVSEDIPNYFQSQILCAGNNVGKEGPCKGDSGGPLFYQDTDTQTFVQVGIVQGSIAECGEKTIPSIYVRLSDHQIFQFISCTLSDTCSKGIEATTENEEGLTKLLVSGGYTTSGNTNRIEIIDLKSSTTTCQDLPNFPLALYGTIGGLGLQDKPTICGGYDHDDGAVYEKCYELQGNKWIPTYSMNSPSKYASVSSPSSTMYKLFVTGGTNEDVSYNTAEGLTEKGWQRILSPLPVKIDEHCSVVVNSTTILIIGGNQNGEISSKTYFFNIETEAWVQGPTLKQLRRQHNCGRIRKDSHSQEMSIIVTGGWIGFQDTSSVEVLDIGANEWRFGPELPFTNDNGEMVEDQDGGVVIIGGAVGSIANGGFSNILFKLSHADGRWTQMEQKLKIERRTHLAFLVPDSVVQCS